MTRVDEILEEMRKAVREYNDPTRWFEALKPFAEKMAKLEKDQSALYSMCDDMPKYFRD